MPTGFLPPFGGGGGAVSSVFGRTGAVVATAGDYTFPQLTLPTHDIANAVYVATLNDYQMFTGTTLTGSRAITLPAASNKLKYVITDPQGKLASFVIQVTPNGTDKINGSNTTQTALSAAFGTTTLVSDGVAEWTMLVQPAAAPVTSVFGRTGVVVATAGDYTFAQLALTTHDIANAAYVATTGDFQMFTGTTLTANRAITLPAGTNKLLYLISDPQNKLSTFVIQVTPNGTDKINGSNTTQTALNTANGKTWLASDGAGNWTMNQEGPTASVTAGTYGSGTQVATVTVTAGGFITAISNTAITNQSSYVVVTTTGSTQTVAVPAWAKFVKARAGSGGGGGGAGASSATGGGGAGGANGIFGETQHQLSDLGSPASLFVSIGAGGLGASAAGPGTNGTVGGAGGNTYVGLVTGAPPTKLILQINGGPGGTGGTSAAGGAGVTDLIYGYMMNGHVYGRFDTGDTLHGKSGTGGFGGTAGTVGLGPKWDDKGGAGGGGGCGGGSVGPGGIGGNSSAGQWGGAGGASGATGSAGTVGLDSLTAIAGVTLRTVGGGGGGGGGGSAGNGGIGGAGGKYGAGGGGGGGCPAANSSGAGGAGSQGFAEFYFW